MWDMLGQVYPAFLNNFKTFYHLIHNIIHKFFIFCYQTDRLREDLPAPDFHSLYRKRNHKKKAERGERS